MRLVRQPHRLHGRCHLLDVPWLEVLDGLEVEGRWEAMTTPTISTVVTRTTAAGRRVPVIDWSAVAVVLVLPVVLVLVLRALGMVLLAGGGGR